MAYQLKQFTKPSVIFVEGDCDEAFFVELVRQMNLQTVQIVSYNGKDRLRQFLADLHTQSGIKVVKSYGVTRDADSDYNAAERAIRGALETAGEAVPDRVGVSKRKNGRKVRYFVLPGTDDTGCLETLCLRTVAENEAIPCVDAYFKCLSASENYDGKLDKAKTKAFLASLDNVFPQDWQAAAAGIWDWNHAALNQLKTFVRAIAG